VQDALVAGNDTGGGSGAVAAREEPRYLPLDRLGG
jgi:hypothetical protein